MGPRVAVPVKFQRDGISVVELIQFMQSAARQGTSAPLRRDVEGRGSQQ